MARLAALMLAAAMLTGIACGIDALGTMAVDAIDGPASADGGASAGDSSAEGGVASDAAVDVSTDGGDPDAGADSGAPVVALCDAGSVFCNGACVMANDCRACAGAKLLCGRTRACAGNCTLCPTSPIECFACDSSQSNPVGSCEPFDAGTFCLDGDYGSGEHCDCSNTNVANCVAPQHVCLPAGGTDWCVTCGENGSATNGKPCKGGGTCNAALTPPRCQ